MDLSIENTAYRSLGKAVLLVPMLALKTPELSASVTQDRVSLQ